MSNLDKIFKLMRKYVTKKLDLSPEKYINAT